MSNYPCQETEYVQQDYTALTDRMKRRSFHLLLVRHGQLSGTVGEDAYEICIVCEVSFNRRCSADPSSWNLLTLSAFVFVLEHFLEWDL